MRYLLDDLDKIKDKLRGRDLLLFLDYDGTLSPIAATPDKSVFSEGMRGSLKKLTGQPRCRIAVISGRGLENIKKKVGLKDIIYSGNHGLEIEGPQLRYKAAVSPLYKKAIGEIKDSLTAGLSKIKGAIIEDKGLSLSLHYRLVRKNDIPALKNILRRTVTDHPAKKRVMVRPGKMVFDIRPASGLDKGKVALWLLARESFRRRGRKVIPIYIGDDSTDEDAFAALKGKGITVCVGGERKSSAQYYLKDTGQVRFFLRRLDGILKEREV
ncbi:MAG: trehalose-phosphatase [Candidatus Omnitrophica bacterium]|nr:trehalose-phosphatase [Candidatus Omnitrophota bacterium]